MESRKAMIKKLKKIGTFLLIALLAFCICAPIVMYFRINSDAHIALREGKNVKLTLHMIDIEYYSTGKTVYDPGSVDGVREDAKERLKEILGHDGRVIIQSYDSKTRSVEAFTYMSDRYQVTYTYDEKDGDTWRVDYLVNVIK